MAKHQTTLLKDAARALIEIDMSNIDATEKSIIRRAYAICSRMLFEKTGKHFLEHEYPKATEKYIR